MTKSKRQVRIIEGSYGEWFACCTDADWSRGGESCNWYGSYRDSRAEAEADARRHRKTHAQEGQK